MNKVNLLRLAQILDEAHAVYEQRRDLPGYDQRHFFHDCGAPACAMGHWAANNPDLYLIPYSSFIDFIRRDGTGSSRNWWGVATDFGLTEPQAKELFSESGCGEAETAAEAAAYIRGFVAREEKVNAQNTTEG